MITRLVADLFAPPCRIDAAHGSIATCPRCLASIRAVIGYMALRHGNPQVCLELYG